MNTHNKNSKTYISVLSVLASLSVVLLHTNGAFWSFSYDRYWVTANIIESVFYYAVPVFLMISGATLIDYRERYTTREYFKKRIAKTVLPFLFWNAVGILYTYILFGAQAMDFSPLGILNAVVNSNVSANIGVYWFFIALFTVYLAIPVFSLIPKDKRKSVFGYIIAVSFVLNALLPLVFSLTQGRLVYNPELSMSLGANYLIYALIGYYIDNFSLSRNKRIVVYVLGILGLMVHLFGTWYTSYQQGAVCELFKDYQNVPCILYSTAVFLLFKNINFEKAGRLFIKVIDFFKGQTYGVYLMHWYIINFCFNVLGVDSRSIVFRIGGAIVIYVVAALITRVFQKIPVLRKLVP